jgi:hypothetical protein
MCGLRQLFGLGIDKLGSWREEYDEIFESEYYKTCCEFDECFCYELFKRNVRARTALMLIEHDISRTRILDDLCDDADRRREIMNSME